MRRVPGTKMSDLDASVKDMFDTQEPGQGPGNTVQDRAARPAVTTIKPGPEPPEQVPGQPPDQVPDHPPGQVPLERLEAQICELAGNLTAATCRFLVLLGDFDAREGWASWEMGSCAQWLSWKCQMSSGTAREHVRVARALRVLPVITAGFAAGRLSYSKVRALTRIADPVTEAGLAGMAAPMTAAQLDRFARAHRQVTGREEGKAAALRRLSWRVEDDGTLAGTFRLPPLEGQVLLKALRAATGDLEHPHGHDSGHGGTAGNGSAAGDGSVDRAGDAPAGAPGANAGDAPAGAPRPDADALATDGSAGQKIDTASLADALVAVAEAYLGAKIAGAENPDIYQVIVHASADMLPAAAQVRQQAEQAAALSGDLLPGTGASTNGAPDPAAAVTGTPAAGAPAGTSPAAGSTRPWDPAGPGRCHTEDGPALNITTMQMLTCEATLSWMTHDQDGTVLDVGRRRRRPTPAIRRAARERDNCRCRFPACESRRVDLHHIQYWSNGGPTKLENLISLCKAHHRLVHKRGYLISAGSGGTFSFWTPDGTPVPACPALPGPRGEIAACHDADITPDTIIPAWYGDRLNLGYAIMVSLANAEHTKEQARQKQRVAEAMAAAA
jgi:5-methylcytosine-specific restriction endonuclease McrA